MPAQISNVYRKTLIDSDFSMGSTSTDVTLVANTWVLAGEYTVPAQQEIAVGITELNAGGQQGRPAYIRLDHTDGNQITADLRIRIKIVDANDQGVTIMEHHASEFSAAGTTFSRTTGLLIPEGRILATEDSKIQIWCKSATAYVLDFSDSDTAVNLPVTIYTVRR